MFGTATSMPGGSVAYRIDLQLSAWKRGSDTFRIRLSNGYDSGPRQIVHGDVDIRLGGSVHGHHDPDADHQDPGAGPDGG